MDLGTAVARARDEAGMTQDQLAEILGVDGSAVSRLEHGDRKVSAYELAMIADAVGTTMDALLGRESPADELAFAARSLPEAAQAELGPALERARVLIETEAVLRRLGAPMAASAAAGDTSAPTSPVAEGESLANELRDGRDDPLPSDLPGFIEDRFGVDVVGVDFDMSLLGLRVRSAGSSLLIYNSSARVGQQRFTLLHELAHHLFGDATHAGSYEVVRQRTLTNAAAGVERRANAFAASMLMPELMVRSIVGDDPSPTSVLRLAAHAGASYSSAMWRTANVGLIDAEQSGSWASRSPSQLAVRAGLGQEWDGVMHQPGGDRPPTRMLKAAELAYQRGLCGAGLVADILNEPDTEKVRASLNEAYATSV